MPKSTQKPPEEDSKSHRKREMDALQKIGEELVKLSPEQLSQFDLPERLLDAVLEGQRMKTYAAIVRQMQYIGKVMRVVDPKPIQAKLKEMDITRGKQLAAHHDVERWRAKLLADDQSFTELVAAYPRADVQRLRALIRNAHKEQTEGRPPKSSRELFRKLRELVQGDRPRS
jgi:ribosome-associated protein